MIKREHTHAPAKDILDLTIGNARVFKEIASAIKSICPCNVYAMGSRVKGNFNTDSDFDVIVYCDEKYKSVINNIPFTHNVDIHFTNKLRTDLIEI